MSSAFLLCHGPIAGAVGLGKGRVLVSVQSDGVACFDTSSQKPVASWALGGADQEFSSAAIYDYASNQCFAPVRPRGAGAAAKSGTVLAWCPDDSGGTITQLAKPLHLPALHRLFPLSRTPEGEAEEAAAAAAEEAAAAEVDGSGQAKAGAVAVYAAGGAALCSSTEVVTDAEEAPGQHTLAASYQGSRLVVVATEARTGGASTAVYCVEGGKLESQGVLKLEAPAAGCRAVAATATAERTAVLWSDGSVAIYLVPGDKQPLLPLLTGDSRQAAAMRRLAGFRLPAGKQERPSGSASSKKRSAKAEVEAAVGGVGMAPVGDRQVAVVGWATGSEGTPVLRLVVLETSAGCVQLAHDFSAADVGLAALDPSKPVQVDSLGGSQLAVSVGSAVLVVSCSDLKPPTLANLLGALAVDRALAVMRRGGGSNGSDGASLLAPAAAGPLLGSTAAAAVNPAAMAAAQVLHPDELAALSAPFGSAARPMVHSMQLEAPTDSSQWLVKATSVEWRVADEAADAQIATEERRVWQEVQQPAALASDVALQQVVAPLLELRRKTGLQLSPRLVARLAMLAAEHSHWDAVAALVAAQPPRLLEDVPGLAAAAADAGRLDLMASLLASSSDMRAAELAAVLQVLLAPPSSAAATAGRQARHKAAAAAAAAAAKAAERAVAAAPQQLAAIQQQQQQQQPGGAGKKSKAARAKTKAAADGSDSDAEDLTAIAPAAYEPGAENGMHAAAVEQQAAVVLERRGEREQAVAACCRAAVEGLDAAQTCLHPVLTARSRAPVLLEALRSLPSQQAVALLRYLAVLLRNHTAMVGSLSAGWQPPLALPAHVALPTLQQALDWSSCLIDAALVKLSMEPEAKPVLAELQGVVESALGDARPLMRVAGLVQHLASRQAQQAQQAVSTADYSVQWLDLRVLPPRPADERRQPAAAPQ